MSEIKKAMCPLFEDVECPQGNEASEACKVRLDGDYDPISDHRDYIFMNCAVRRAREQSQD